MELDSILATEVGFLSVRSGSFEEDSVLTKQVEFTCKLAKTVEFKSELVFEEFTP